VEPQRVRHRRTGDPTGDTQEAKESVGNAPGTRNDLETSVLVGQIRSTALDLLQAAGMSSSEDLEALRQASRTDLGLWMSAGVEGSLNAFGRR
jgi:hypothetical protein